MIFMTHEKHGANWVKPHEVPAMESNGWKVTTEAEWLEAKAVKTAEVAEETFPVDTPKRGRPRKV